MTHGSGNILVINYDFPPNQGIGGRRWAKLSKQLARMGYHIFVLKADQLSHSANSTWTKDAVHENIYVLSLPRRYPAVLSRPTKRLIDRVLYKLAIMRLKRKEHGTIYDISIGWEEVMLPAARKLIAENQVKNVIATGAPWNLLVAASRLKSDFPDLNLIVDFRDPWLNARNYGMPGLDAHRRKTEETKQVQVISNADVVLSPDEHLTSELEDFADQHNIKGPKFKTLSHFFDPDDIDRPATVNSPGKIVFVYGGDLYLELEPQLQKLRDAIVSLKNARPDLYRQVEFRFFCNNPEVEIFSGLDVVTMQGSIDLDIFRELQSASFCMVLLSYSKRHQRTTKYFEYMQVRKPLLVVAEDGDVTQFTQDHKLGYVLRKPADLERMIEDATAGNIDFNSQFDLSEYSLSKKAEQLIQYLK